MKEDLGSLPRASPFPRKDSAVWVVYPRSRKEVREGGMMAAGSPRA
jgi:hypothetical protein